MSIEELRETAEKIYKLPKSELCDLWSLSEEHFSDEDVEEVKNGVRALLGERYDEFSNLPDNVFIREYIPEEPGESSIITYICPLSQVNYLSKKYMPYDRVLLEYTKEDPDWKFTEHFNEIDTTEKGLVCLVRLIYPSRFDSRHTPSVQVFPCDLMEIGSNLETPWGPYEFTPFCGTDPYDRITLGELEKDINDFIKKYNLQRSK